MKKNQRGELLDQYFPQNEFIRIFVYFNLSDEILSDRILASSRKTNIFRDEKMMFEQLLHNQGKIVPPTEDEADFLFVINDTADQMSVIEWIKKKKL